MAHRIATSNQTQVPVDYLKHLDGRTGSAILASNLPDSPRDPPLALPTTTTDDREQTSQLLFRQHRRCIQRRTGLLKQKKFQSRLAPLRN